MARLTALQFLIKKKKKMSLVMVWGSKHFHQIDWATCGHDSNPF